MPMRLVAVPGCAIMSMPIPLWRVRWPLSMPIITPVMERIMMTSMATAKTLMRERRGRWTRLPTTSLFIPLPVYGRVAGSGAGRAEGFAEELAPATYGTGALYALDSRALANDGGFGSFEEGAEQRHEIGGGEGSYN